MKKLNSFWRIFIYVFGGILIAGLIFLIVLFGWLNSYEKNAQIKEQQKADYIKALEQEGNYQDAIYKIDSCVKVLDGISSSRKHAMGYYERSYAQSPGVFASTIEDSIRSEGFSYLFGIDGFITGRETKESVSEYINSTYDKNNVRHAVTSNGDSYICEFFCADDRVAAFTFVIDGKDGEYGIPTWKIGECKSLFPVKDYTVKAPEGAIVEANGFEVEKGELEICDIMQSLDGVIDVYNARVYTVKGLIAPPKLTATLNGETLRCDKNGNFLYPEYTLTSSEKAAFSDIATSYGEYIAGDIDLDDVTKRVLRKSPLSVRLGSFDNRWYDEHDKIVNTEVTFTNVQKYGDGCISAVASYTQQLYRGGKVRKEVAVSIMMLVVESNGKWLAAEILTV